MKNLWILFLCATLFSACAKKTYTESKNRLTTQSTTSQNSALNTSVTTIDKTVTTKSRRYDTSFIIAGDTLKGTIDARKQRFRDYETDNLHLFLTADSNGLVKAMVISKPTPIHIKVNEIITRYNDILRNDNAKSEVNLKTDYKIDSLAELETRQVEPRAINDVFKKLSMVTLSIIGIAILAFYGFKMLKKT